MCAASLTVDVRSFDATRLKIVTGSGIAAGLAGVAGFGLAHAVIITPIWSRLLGGLPFALFAGLAIAAAYDQLPGAATASLGSGVQLGAAMIATLMPATAFDSFLRVAGLRRADAFETAIAIGLAVAAGGAMGLWWTRRRAGSVAFAIAALALVLASAGPLPAAQSPKGLWLSIAIAPITLLAGVTIASTRRLFRTDPS